MDILTYVRTVLNLFPKTKIHVCKLVDTLRFIKQKWKIVRMYVRTCTLHVHCKYLIGLSKSKIRTYYFFLSLVPTYKLWHTDRQTHGHTWHYCFYIGLNRHKNQKWLNMWFERFSCITKGTSFSSISIFFNSIVLHM